ncbi:Rap1a/Tai family immunity protein [Burkholderia gladioli]|uniref:Rap1a/Tai family immunity protein n=1 Tax=Burkholderia gladioli TaxID=28095 RepID=UPI001C5E41F2|nr:Rap1a/Tai family immunity protein [Burkholderia gladioli]MBW5285969.1 hypothetical protein [Burkholderia gladioli]
MKVTKTFCEAALVSAFLAVPFESTADVLDGNFYYHLCNSDAISDRNLCHVYVAGWVDGVVLTEKRMNSRRTICPPTGVHYEQFKDVFVAYLNQHPEQRQLLPSEILEKAIPPAFPCR